MNEPPKINTPPAGPPKPVFLRPEEQLISSIETIGSLFDEIKGSAEAPAALPKPTGLTIEDRLQSAQQILGELSAAKNRMTSSAKPGQQGDPPALITQGAGPQDIKGAGVVVHKSSTATITRYQGRSATRPRDPALSQSPTEGTEVIRLKNATITRFATGKSSANGVMSPTPESKLTNEWLALKLKENEGAVPAGTAFDYWKKNQAGIRKERLRARNPDVHIV